jgi:hypothetical protein
MGTYCYGLFFLVLVCGTHAQNLSALFSYSLCMLAGLNEVSKKNRIPCETFRTRPTKFLKMQVFMSFPSTDPILIQFVNRGSGLSAHEYGRRGRLSACSLNLSHSVSFHRPFPSVQFHSAAISSKLEKIFTLRARYNLVYTFQTIY